MSTSEKRPCLDLYTAGALSAQLQVPVHRVLDTMRGLGVEPYQRVNGTPMFTGDDVDLASAKLAESPRGRAAHAKGGK